MSSIPARFRTSDPPSVNGADYVPRLVSWILQAARDSSATDVHLVPQADGLQMDWRIDGVLHSVARFEPEFTPKIVARLKVVSGLLTYRCDIPQEGRIAADAKEVETRVSTFPTLHGEKAVVRLFAAAGQYQHLDQLGLPVDVGPKLKRLLGETSGVILITGPAGSGKTTTIYSCLREIVDESRGGRSLVSLEDPIEVIVSGVAQSQVNDSVGFTLEHGLRSLMRQDPEVIMVGEIRDRSTAETVFQASLTGHLVITTFHAGSAAGAISRLLDMGIEPYLLRSSLRAILSQRLMRRLCGCAVTNESSNAGVDIGAVIGGDIRLASASHPVGCEVCHGTGYSGRMLLTEMIEPDSQATSHAILAKQDTATIHSAAVSSGMIPQSERAMRAIESGQTSVAEIYRVLGRLSQNEPNH
jgi:general secretion pathway protein E